MSTSKRSVYSSKIESIQQADSAAHSPDKALLVAKQGITRDSPRRPILLEPITNSNQATAPSVQPKPTDSTPAAEENTEPAQEPSNPVTTLKQKEEAEPAEAMAA